MSFGWKWVVITNGVVLISELREQIIILYLLSSVDIKYALNEINYNVFNYARSNMTRL